MCSAAAPPLTTRPPPRDDDGPVREGAHQLAAGGRARRAAVLLGGALGRARWADEAEGGVIRLHSPDIAFYVQSALESAQLLLLAC
jgi:hypothetical protein